VFTAGVVLKAVIFLFEMSEKRSRLIGSYKNTPVEATSGVMSRSVFWWLTPLFRKGFKNILSFEDLFPIDERMNSSYTETEIVKHWDERRYSPASQFDRH
jgi:hypothetical protein